MKKYDLTDLETYYLMRKKYDESFLNNLTHQQRLQLHPLLLAIIKLKNKLAGFDITTIYDKRQPTSRPQIFCITHIGKFDIEVSSEIIGDHYYLLSGDFENMKGTIEEKFLGLNGVVYVREDDREDRKRSKEKMINILKSGGNLMYFPEGTWNLSPNLPVLQCPYGIIEVAMKSGATIIPIGIEQYGKNFIAAVGENFEASKYDENEKLNAISDLRDAMAKLKWDIWESIPDDYRTSMDSEGFSRYIEDRLKEWPNFTFEEFQARVFQPKGISSEKQVYNFLETLEINQDNSFLAKSKEEYTKTYKKMP